MKTIALVVMSAFLMSVAVPVFAMTHQQRIACAMTAGNCLDEAKALEKEIMEIKNEIKKRANESTEDMKKLENKLQKATDRLNETKEHQ